MQKLIQLPKEILDLFPTWEYRCPKCNAFLGYKPVDFCVKCGATFSHLQARVPPRCLKSYEAMSEYAHRVLAPKLSPGMRELLFKYFTEIFSDGFESGDFSAWTGTNTTLNYGYATVETTNPHHGTYSAKFEILAQAAWTNANSYKEYTAQATVFTRIYLYVDAFTPGAGAVQRAFIRYGGTARIAAEIGLTSGCALQLRYWNDPTSSYVQIVSSTVLSLDTWYSVELKTIISATAGECRVWVDGSEITDLTVTGIDNDGAGNIDTTIVGIVTSYNLAAVEFVDCVVVADTYIGLEAAVQTYTKTYGADALLKKPDITKAYSADVLLSKPFTKSYLAGVLLLKPVSKAYPADVLLKKSDVTKTYNADTLLKKPDLIKSYPADVLLLKPITKTYPADTLLKKPNITKTYTVDVILGEVWTGIIKSELSMLERGMSFEEGEVEMRLEGLERKMKIEVVTE